MSNSFQTARRENVRKDIPFFKRLVFILLFAVIAIAAVEGCVRIAEVVLRPPGPHGPIESSIFPDKQMARELFREYNACEGKSVLPLAGWGAKECHGKYVNVGSNGARRTWAPAASAGKPIKIFVLGGSTAFGYGARDDYTIPSFISKLLNGGGQNRFTYEVRNYGEGNYSMLQGSVRLTSLLMAGERPDIVIYYGGANDISFVYDYGEPGVAAAKTAAAAIVGERVLATPKYRARIWMRGAIDNYCHACRIGISSVRAMLPRFLHGEHYEEHRWDEKTIADYSRVTAQEYRQDFMEYTNRLAESFRFQSAVFWQPTLHTESKRVGEERPPFTLDSFLDHPVLHPLFQRIYGGISTVPERNLYKLTDALEDRTKSCYLDAVHISEECNEMVAARIVSILKDRYLSSVEKEAR